eukprot:TRINITY_DN16729_c2_g1_i1.p1 TRINITY_DN16729_c2_g1~~TRINITY_DN16729_c2_g1_i1.p1  ORF type:complete len:581 (+),score=95.03 TRINITY_DN16729_c2_g1_i1:56-1798(+)
MYTLACSDAASSSDGCDSSDSGSASGEEASEPGALGDELRSKTLSWMNLPQSQRGITLNELWTFYNERKEWMEEPLWRCSKCFTSSAPGKRGPCEKPGCGSDLGELQMRNLYEVHKEMILPRCAEEQISFVEYLDRHERPIRGGVKVDTFVSHFWGEEFPLLLRSLDRYAQVQSAATRRWFFPILAAMCFSTSYPFILHLIAKEQAVCVWLELRGAILEHEFHFSPCHLYAGLGGVGIIAAFCIALVLTSCRKRDPGTWSFWICAFANNQYALDHAIDEEGDACKSAFAEALRSPTCNSVVAVLDKHGSIYKRIWCGFELFFATLVLPKRFQRSVSVSLINEFGVLSQGDGELANVKVMEALIRDVNIEQSQASVESDRRMILDAIRKEGASCDDLDDILRDLADEAVPAVRWRRYSPMVLISMTPLAMADISLAVIYACLYAYLPDVARKMYPEIRTTIITTSTIGIGCVIVLWICFKTCGRLRGQASKQKRNAFHRLMGLTAVQALPLIVASTYLLAGIFGGGSFNHNYYAFGVVGVAVVCNVSLSVLGLLFGAVYALARDFQCLQQFRRGVDDFLFA